MAYAKLALTLLAGFLQSLPGNAAAGTIRIDYAVSIRGFPVGEASLTAEVADGRYAITFSGGVRGIARLFSDAATTANAGGRIGDDRLEPQSYSHRWSEDGEIETVEMRFKKRGVSDIAVDPPQKRPERYVPLTTDTKADAFDPVSAFLWPASGGADKSLCDRTLQLIDGKRRFDIALSFSRTEHFATRDIILSRQQSDNQPTTQ